MSASPAKQSGPSGTTSKRLSLNTNDIPKLNPTPTRTAGSPGQSPVMQSPDSPDSPDALTAGSESPQATLYLGDTVRSENFLSVQDPNTLSASEFVMHHNQAALFTMLDRQTAAIEKLSSSKKFDVKSGGKVGQFNEEEQSVTEGLLKDYHDLLKKVTLAYGKDIKGENDKLTAKAGEKLNKQAEEWKSRLIDAAAAECDDEGKDVTAAMDQLSEKGMRAFFRNVVQTFVPAISTAHSDSKVGENVRLNKVDRDILEAILDPNTTHLRIFNDKLGEFVRKKLDNKMAGIKKPDAIKHMQAFANWILTGDDDGDTVMAGDSLGEEAQFIGNQVARMSKEGAWSLWKSVNTGDVTKLLKSRGGIEQGATAPTKKRGRPRKEAILGSDDEYEDEDDGGQGRGPEDQNTDEDVEVNAVDEDPLEEYPRPSPKKKSKR